MRIRQNNGKRSFWDESDILTFWNDKQTSRLTKKISNFSMYVFPFFCRIIIIICFDCVFGKMQDTFHNTNTLKM